MGLRGIICVHYHVTLRIHPEVPKASHKVSRLHQILAGRANTQQFDKCATKMVKGESSKIPPNSNSSLYVTL